MVAKPLALARLRKAVARAKPFAEGLDADWLHLATEQHEGYLQLVSQIDTAMREIDKYR